MAEATLAQLRARAIVRKLKIEKPSDLSIEDIAWIEGALVIENGLRGADARLVATPGVRPAIIRVNATVTPPGRKRFAIAHELGHLELNHNPGGLIECAEQQFLIWYQSQNSQEVDANVFAAELLMPEALVVRRLERSLPSMELIEQVSSEFQTTLTATAIRYVDFCGERCAVIFSVGGKIRWIHRSPEFREWISPGEALSSNTYAADFFSEGRVSTKMETVRLDAWVKNASPREEIKEQNRPMPSYNAVLTLLWRP